MADHGETLEGLKVAIEALPFESIEILATWVPKLLKLPCADMITISSWLLSATCWSKEDAPQISNGAGLDPVEQERLPVIIGRERSRERRPRIPSRSRSRSRDRVMAPSRAPAGHLDAAARLEEACVALGLDEGAARMLQQFPPDEALGMLDQVGHDVRNPSAFISSMAQRRIRIMQEASMDVSKGQTQREMEREVLSLAEDMELDMSCTEALRTIPAEDALMVLDRLQASMSSIRNRSAFVCAEVKRVTKDGGHGGHVGGAGDRLPPREREREPTQRELEQKVRRIAYDLGLDDSCLEALRSIRVEDALRVLERLSGSASSIRNPSAFVFAEVKRMPAPLPVVHHAPPSRSGGGGSAKAIQCKFFLEGRCKNGSDCRFAHD